MADSFKIKITIADRVYPLTISNPDEEEGLRKAAKKTNDLVAQFEQNYAVGDKQDVLAMCALQFASLIEIKAIANEQEMEEAKKKIETLQLMLNKYIE
ncbi:MAG: cell division protein ZapA [Flavobacteriaceae bacterium]|nr:cell division protein ZapA [Flavobacteriaceae bacterium]